MSLRNSLGVDFSDAEGAVPGNVYYTEHCSVWSYQFYRDYYNYRQYDGDGTDEDFWMKISRRFLEDSRFLEFSRDF